MIGSRLYTNITLEKNVVAAVIDTGAEESVIPSTMANALGMSVREKFVNGQPAMFKTPEGLSPSMETRLNDIKFGKLSLGPHSFNVAGGKYANRPYINIGLDILKKVRLWKQRNLFIVYLRIPTIDS
jgi:predicted aspartyl protease